MNDRTTPRGPAPKKPIPPTIQIFREWDMQPVGSPINWARELSLLAFSITFSVLYWGAVIWSKSLP